MKLTTLSFTISIVFLCSNCTEKTQNASQCCNKEDSSQTKINKANVSLAENSIYQVDASWQNQLGNKIKLSDLKGKVNVVAMIFSNCTYACPRIVADMQSIESSLPKTFLENINFTLISFDVERDTPQRLLEFSKEMQLNKKWILLHGTESDTHEMSLLLGIKYEKEEDGSFAHSNIITVLDQEGAIVYQQEGLGVSQTETILKIKNLLQN